MNARDYELLWHLAEKATNTEQLRSVILLLLKALKRND